MYEGVWLLPAIPRLSTSETVIEVIEQNLHEQREKNFDKPVVKNSNAPEPKEMSDPAQFMAEKNQRFDKQTRATKLGAFENRQPSQGGSKTKAQNQAAAKTPASNDEGDVPEFAREMQQQMARVQESTVPYELPREIQSGSATNLNADAHVYASFYNRILNLFYVRWSERLNALFERMPTAVYKTLSGKSWTTEVEIWLNADGLYQEGLVMTSSGYKPFDDAGIYAFRSAKFFPNPPRSKVQADGGRVRLRYRIRVNVY
ncbi:MAG: energy transducer TonB [Bdellovibrionota bacterium]